MKKELLEEYFAVELAVKIQDLLEPGDDLPPYEYVNEARKIANYLLEHGGVEVEEIAQRIARELSDSLEFEYSFTDFMTIAIFAKDRSHYLSRYTIQ